MSSVNASSRDRKAVRRTVDRYATGLRGQVETLRKAFGPQAVVSGYVGKQPYRAHVKELVQWVHDELKKAKGVSRLRYKIQSVRVAGRTATVQLSENDCFDVDFETNLQLMKIRGRWLIVSKLFSGKELHRSN